MLEDAKLLIKVIESGNFSEAARELNVAVSSISRRIKKLETRLGAPLFYRNSRKFELTTEGRAYYSYMNEALRNVVKAERAVQVLCGSYEGSIQIASGKALTNHVLAPIVARFSREHPNISIKIHSSDESLTFAPKDVDIVFYMGELKDSELIATEIMQETLVLVCSRSFLEENDVDRNDKVELFKHHITYPSNYASDLRKQEGLASFSGNAFPKIVINDSESTYHMVKAGIGVAVLPRFVVSEDVSSGNLIELNDILAPIKAKVNAVFQVPPSKSPRINKFMHYVNLHLRGG
ncbi:LysR family transcriptional regulator [Pseudomaricurvus alkylphenolicus]|uniref:LysR family transcriptional regulator n=1 Tax=Pseudomaricurvus alkylphenolicus TaxID=1306991 RepID=UPI00141F9785|nr:LysR family transcriptional regulator [Pseudomaricurvus alkylphenolicus]NIB37980.1 LysR family transcriptional regulator [Pseudomaricurvus alkylphenolicus]